MAEKVKNIRFVMPGGKADMGKLGQIFGMNGISNHSKTFLTDFNEKTKDKVGKNLRVKLCIYDDKSITYEIKNETTKNMLLSAIGKDKGSKNPNVEKIGEITMDQIEKIAKEKMSDLNAFNIESAKNTIIACAGSIGIVVSDLKKRN